MSVRLIVRQRSEEGDAGQPRELVLDEPAITLGRDKTCQVPLPLQAVSRNHARISQDGALFFVEDLGSVYGTQVNGQALPKGEKRLLRDGDLIAIAQFDISFQRVPDLPPEDAEQDRTGMMGRHMVKSAMRGLGGGEGPYFRIMNGPEEGRHIQLTDARELVFGRDEDVDVVLKDDLVSRRHAKVRRDWAGTHVEDLASRNGVRVNRKRVTRKTLTDRDELEVGGVKLLYVDPSEVRDAPAGLAEELEREPTPPTAAPPPEPDPEQDEAPEEGSEAAEPDSVAEEPSQAEPEPSEASAAPPPEDEAEGLDAEGTGSELDVPQEQEEEQESAPDEQADWEDQAPRKVEIRQWIVLGVAGCAALLVLALVLLILVGA